MNSDRTLYFTICSANYLAYARTLAGSLNRADPSSQLVTFVVDRSDEALVDATRGELNIIFIEDINISGFDDICFKYSIMELNTAVKALCFDYVFDVLHYENAIYLDPDIFVISKLSHVEAAIADGASCVLTPHASRPSVESTEPNDYTFLLNGAYNLGFVAFANVPEARSYIAWWREKLRDDCFVAHERGVFVDQKYFDLAPCFLDNISILRHPGHNLAYWNLDQRPVTNREGGLFICSEFELCFVHFSGVVPADPRVYSKHQSRFRRTDLGALMPVYDEYIDRLKKNDVWRSGSRFSDHVYSYGVMHDGTPITEPMRQVYARYKIELPRDTSPFSLNLDFFNATSDVVPNFGDFRITRTQHALWNSRKDLKGAFDLRTPEGQLSYLRWLRISPSGDGLPAEFRPGPPENNTAPQTGAATAAGAAAADPLLIKALTSRSFMWRNLFRRYARGRTATLDYWFRAERSAALKDGVAVYGYFQAETGVGEAARGLAAAIRTTDIATSFHRLASPDVLEDAEAFDVSKQETPEYDTLLICANADATLGLQDLVPPRVLHGRRRIGHWVWELPTFPAAWAAAAAKLDEIWVPSRYVAVGLHTATDKPVRIVPYAVQRVEEAAHSARSHFDLPQDVPLILMNFDYNSYVDRKNPAAALRAFLDAFPTCGPSSPHLVIKTHGRRVAADAEWMKLIHENRRVHIIDKVLPRLDVNKLQNACDVFLSLHRAEGFGLNLAECMLLGKLVVATGFSGNLDFMSEENAMLLPYEMVPVGRDRYPYWYGQYWADPVHEAAVEALRFAVSGSEEIERLTDRARADIRDGYSVTSVGRIARDALGGQSTIDFG